MYFNDQSSCFDLSYDFSEINYWITFVAFNSKLSYFIRLAGVCLKRNINVQSCCLDLSRDFSEIDYWITFLAFYSKLTSSNRLSGVFLKNQSDPLVESCDIDLVSPAAFCSPIKY